METARQKYQELTGKEAKNLVLLDGLSYEQFAKKIGILNSNGSGKADSCSLYPLAEFIEIHRVDSNIYRVHTIGGGRKKTDGQFYLVDSTVLVGNHEVGPAAKSLNIGDYLVVRLKATDLADLTQKNKPYLNPRVKPAAKKQIQKNLDRANVSESQLLDNPFKIHGDDKNGYLVGMRTNVSVHVRPSALLAKTRENYDCDVIIKRNGKTRYASSVMGIVSLELEAGSTFIIEAKGLEARQCLEDLVDLVKSDFSIVPKSN